jgi:hypothetical protein
MKLTKNYLKKIIAQEIKSIVDEDALFNRPSQGDPYFIRRDRLDHDLIDRDYEEHDACHVCGTHHDDDQCPGKDHDYHVVKSIINEVCGCQSKSKNYKHGMKDYSLNSVDDVLSPGKAFGVGYTVSDHKHKHHKGSSYMAKPQLGKIAKYASLLHNMIGENEEIQDWQESKIAQISQMIGDVYHSLEYKKGH